MSSWTLRSWCASAANPLVSYDMVALLTSESASDENGEPVSDFPRCMFMVGEWLMETTELLAQFIALYQVSRVPGAEAACCAFRRQAPMWANAYATQWATG